MRVVSFIVDDTGRWDCRDYGRGQNQHECRDEYDTRVQYQQRSEAEFHGDMIEIIGFRVKRYEACFGLKQYYACGYEIADEQSPQEQA